MPVPSRLLPGLLLLCASAWLPTQTLAQTPPAPVAVAKSPSPKWEQLSQRDRKALAPLAARWGEISDTQRSKWLAIARHYDQLSTDEKQTMQARMAEWVALSPVQRNQARLNFNNLQSLPKDQKKNRWDEYQALSEEEKRKLTAGAPAPAKTTAPSPKPTAADRLVQPTVRSVPAAALPPRAPIDKNTLLPVPAPALAPEPVSPTEAPAAAKEAPGS